MKKRQSISLFISLAFLYLVVLCLSQCSSNKVVENAEKRWFLNLADSAKYVGMAACQTCHSGIHASFKETGMGKSFKEAKPDLSAAHFDGHEIITDGFSGYSYQPFWRNDSLFVKEFYEEAGIKKERIEHINYIVGSGQHTNSHIINRNGYLYQAPFTYYTQEGKLDLPPGFENGNNTRFSRAIGMECISCHNAYPHHIEGSLNKYSKVPNGIDCERCHGPGSIHVAEKKAGKMVDIVNDTDFTIVNPRKLPYKFQVDVCQRCHLQGNAILKEGKTWEDFKPGMRLSEVMDVFMPALENEEGTFVMASHPDRLKLSACFLQSANNSEVEALSCITCHNPHQSVQKTKKAYFNTKCADCHTNKTVANCLSPSTNTNCVECHMKPSQTVDIPHVSVTDHFIRVYKDEIESEKKAENKIMGLRSMTAEEPSDLLMLKAYLNFIERFDHSQALVDSAEYYASKPGTANNDKPLIHFHFLMGNYKTVVELAAKLANADLDYETNYRIGQSLEFIGEFDHAAGYYKKAVALEPLRHSYRIKLANILLKNGDYQAAKANYEFIIKEQSWNLGALNGMGFLNLLQFNLKGAESYFLQVLELDRSYEPALINMAKIYLARNEKEKAIAQLKRTLEFHPNSSNAALLLKEFESSP